MADRAFIMSPNRIVYSVNFLVIPPSDFSSVTGVHSRPAGVLAVRIRKNQIGDRNNFRPEFSTSTCYNSCFVHHVLFQGPASRIGVGKVLHRYFWLRFLEILHILHLGTAYLNSAAIVHL